MASRSDVKSILITADANAADDDSVFANQRPNTDETINGPYASGCLL